MGKSQREKGKRGERNACKLLRRLGYSARRAQQYQGAVRDDHSADLITDIEGVRVEVKTGHNNQELWTKGVQRWVQVAEAETPAGERWLILWKRDFKKWTGLCRGPGGILIQSHQIEGLLDYLQPPG